ncbi:MAG: site-specific integrase, partial [Firmicutes bacterium]|nr:site-specific integrase [Bacillota bacterium]
NKKLYLLIKLFGTTGISIQNLRNVTVEAVNRGVVCTEEKDYVIPAYLLNDMKTYVKEEHIGSGPIFITKAGKPLNRTVVNSIMKTLSAAAQVEEEKITPRCLKKMYQGTRAFFEQRVNDLVERAYEQLLSTEQTLVGWDPAPELFYEEEQEKEKQR